MRKITFTLVLLLCSMCAYAQTQGTLEAANKKGKTLGACPLKNTKVQTDISGFLARVKVTQEFENNFAEPIEAVYVFPLSQTAAVDDMTMLVGTRTIRGKIMRREEARKVYETAKSEGKTASLLDQERPNIFTQSVANILPNEKIIIEISYVETLKYEDGAYEFVFPMTVAPRYNPRSVADASRISPPAARTRGGHDVSIEVNLNAGVPVEAIRSNSHEIETLNLSANSASVKLKNQNTIPNKDFILRYDVTGKRIEDAVLTHRDERGGFFTLILQPPDRFTTEDVTPKEIVFVLDTSGSMEGFPIEKAKEAMKLSLENLYPNDTFNLITFAGDTSILFDKPVPATQANLEKAREFLATRQGYGGTEMMTAIKAALEPSDASDHVRVVCFMTDGEIGNDLEVISEVQKHPNARVFSFGIGQSVNRFLLDKIAEEGRGEAEYVSLEDDDSKAAKRFYERVRTPLLTDVSIDWNGLPVADVYPNRISDLFSAKTVIIHGRYTKGASGTIKLNGKVGGQDLVREIAVNFPETESRNDVLATLWARTRIDDLMKHDYKGVQDGNAKPEVQATIANIGLEYRLLTQFTSFVAVEEIIKTQGGQPTKVEVPVNLPEGMSGEDSPFEKMEVVASLQRPPAKTKGKTRVAYGQGSGSGNGSGGGAINSAQAQLSTTVTARQVTSLPTNGRSVSNLAVITPGLVSSGDVDYITSGDVSANGNRGRSNNFTIDGQDDAEVIKVETDSDKPRKISTGVLNGRAVSLPKPVFPPAASAVRASGAVTVQITIDESGKVISATAVSGHPLLRYAAEQAARKAKFAPVAVSDKPVKITGVIVYNFINAETATETSIDKMRVAPLTAEEKQNKILAEKLHVWLYALVERVRKNINAPTVNEAKFVKDGAAEIQIQFLERTPDAMEKLKTLGFEVVSEKDKNLIVGRIAVEKIAGLAEITEIEYVLPKLD